MANAALIFLVYGPIVITLVCWLFVTLEESRARQPPVIAVLNPPNRAHPESNLE